MKYRYIVLFCVLGRGVTLASPLEILANLTTVPAGAYALHVEVENKTDRELSVRIEDSPFFSNESRLLILASVRRPRSIWTKHVFPIQDFSIIRESIPPHSKLSRDIELDDFGIDVVKTQAQEPLVLFWRLQIKTENGFSASCAGAADLSSVKSK